LSDGKFRWNKAYISGEYKNHWHYSHPSQELATLLASGIVRKGRALDIGCGAGVETMFLAESDFRASGIDLSDKAIELGQVLGQTAAVANRFPDWNSSQPTVP
jgi:2-polyprenyl-3-methyl-5-hydroxy-6-metoxy-1,4-benzoquinol methylase